MRVPRAAMGVARFSFHDLCEQPLAAADYLRIAHEFHTLIIDRIPVMDFEQRNEAKRFIILIDTLYDHAVKLVASAAAEPDALYRAERRLRGARVQAHRLAPDRDALAGLSGAAARPAMQSRPDRRGHRGDVNGYCGFTPVAFRIGGQRRISAARNATYSCVDQSCGSKPSLPSGASSGDFIASLISALSLSRCRLACRRARADRPRRSARTAAGRFRPWSARPASPCCASRW